MNPNVRSFVHFLSLTFLFLLFFGCTQDEEEPEVELVELSVSTTKIILNENGLGEFILSLKGDDEYEMKSVLIPDWLNLLSESILVSSEGLRLEVKAISNLAAGDYEGIIELTTSGGGKAVIAVAYKKLATSLSISEDILDFGYFENEKTFSINNGDGPTFNWEIINTNPFIQYMPASGSLNSGNSTLVKVLIDRAVLTTKVTDLEIRINNDQPQSVAQQINIDFYKEEKLLISGKVIDAEYNRDKDSLIFVSTEPNEIRKYNSKSGETVALPLNMPPNCVSVSQDGNFAAVGHNGRFSYVDLTTMQLVLMYQVTCDVSDIVLAPNYWVYAFPAEYQGTAVRCVNLDNKLESLTEDWAVYGNEKAKLHPTGQYIYTANNGVTPSDFGKLDIREGVAKYLYDSKYHGEFEFAGNLWMNENGSRLFAKSRNAFDAAEDKTTDMLYDGALEGEQFITTMDIHTVAKKLYAILETGNGYPKIPDSYIRLYDSNFLTYKSQIKLPGFLKSIENGEGQLYDSEGHFGFFDASGSQFHLLVKRRAAEEELSSEDWAIVSLAAE